MMKQIAAIIGAVLFVSCTTKGSPGVDQRVDGELLSYSIDASDIVVEKESVEFPFAVEGMKTLSETCQREYEGHARDVAESFEGVTGTAYRFHHIGETQDERDFVVSVFPNVRHYADIDSFRSDFESCYAGGDFYPHAISRKSIVFVNGCGTGYDDGSGKPHGCEEAKRAVERSILPL